MLNVCAIYLKLCALVHGEAFQGAKERLSCSRFHPTSTLEQPLCQAHHHVHDTAGDDAGNGPAERAGQPSEHAAHAWQRVRGFFWSQFLWYLDAPAIPRFGRFLDAHRASPETVRREPRSCRPPGLGGSSEIRGGR